MKNNGWGVSINNMVKIAILNRVTNRVGINASYLALKIKAKALTIIESLKC